MIAGKHVPLYFLCFSSCWRLTEGGFCIVQKYTYEHATWTATPMSDDDDGTMTKTLERLPLRQLI